jgi:1-pyrroline-5-carboxylate dehydrogenase
MNNTALRPPIPSNEPVKSYAPGSPERASLRAEIARMREETVPVGPWIGGEWRETGRTQDVVAPHEHRRVLATAHNSRPEDVQDAIQTALDARHDWMRMAWSDRASIFLKAAELLAGPFRDRMNASTMLGQSKNPFQAEIDAACEMADFFRYNVHFLRQIYEDQPESAPGVWNRVEYRPLEGFVFAVSPFNFTSIAANLCTAPALLGNTVLWKPSHTQLRSARVICELLEAAGLPPGVISMLPGEGADVGDPVLASPDLAGLHFTGSTKTFQHLWSSIGTSIGQYKTYPRIVGETGGKDFILAHESADPAAVATAIVRGAFEYQGQKCSAASRVYVPQGLWKDVEAALESQLGRITVGPVEDFSHFVNAVIDERSYDKITGYIERARASDDAEILYGGGHSKEDGYFVQPTVVLAKTADYESMQEEIFGPVATIYVGDESFEELMDTVDRTSPYALTGAVFATERTALAQATDRLSESAGNFYLNDKPTGAVVGQQPFGGARGSGTNDKAGSYVNLLRWTSLRTLKETFVPSTDFAYPFHQAAPDEESIGDASAVFNGTEG